MGDYNVQIVSAKVKVKKEEIESFRREVESRLPLCDSAYHATAPFIEIQNDVVGTVLTMVTQAKYNRGVDEFLDWLKPFVTGGMGEDEAWSINFSEFSREPQIRYMRDDKNE